MRAFVIGFLILSTLLGGAGAAFSQSVEIGPGGVRVNPDRPRVYEERRYDERRYDEDRPRYSRRGRGLCAELRAACEDGERGQGNCRRYRETCN